VNCVSGSQEIAPRFPHGWTVYNASGAWMSQAQPGLVVEEGSKVRQESCLNFTVSNKASLK
jgi:hypothetical protein